jgi:hypothetical protein
LKENKKMKCEHCGYDDRGTGDSAHHCPRFDGRPAFVLSPVTRGIDKGARIAELEQAIKNKDYARNMLLDRIKDLEATAPVAQQDQRIAVLKAENASLLQANRDCMDHFNELKADYDALLAAEPLAQPGTDGVQSLLAALDQATAERYTLTIGFEAARGYAADLRKQLAAPVAQQEPQPVAWMEFDREGNQLGVTLEPDGHWPTRALVYSDAAPVAAPQGDGK